MVVNVPYKATWTNSKSACANNLIDNLMNFIKKGDQYEYHILHFNWRQKAYFGGDHNIT